jgi:hypothetical protein
MATADPQYNPAISGSTPPVIFDGTGLTTTVPLTIKNGKSGSGVEVQVTSTITSGYSLLNSSGTTKGGLHLIATAGDEITGSVAGDVTITGDATKKLLIGALSGSAAMVNLDFSNGLLGVNCTPAGTRFDVADPSTSNNTGRFKATSASGIATVAVFASANQGLNIQAGGASSGATVFGVSTNAAALIRGNNLVNFLVVGTDGAAPLLFGTNNVEQARLTPSVGLTLSGSFCRLQEAKGADIASATTVTLGAAGNTFKITGTTTIDGIVTTNWQAGSIVYLWFSGALTFTHSSGAPGASAVAMLLSGSVNLTTAANTILTLVYDGTNWQEVCRKVA